MNSLNPSLRPWMAGVVLAGSALFCNQAMAVTTPLTSPLSVIGGIETDLTNVRGTFDPVWHGGAASYASHYDLTEMTMGGSLLLTEAAARLTFTLVGFESTLNNVFTAGGKSVSNFTTGSEEQPNLGASFTFENVAAGLLNFGFLSNGAGALKGNGHVATGIMLAADNRSALVLFNDRFGDRDFDDMVVKLTVTPVPEPETISMLLAGLGLMGLMARRQQRRR